MKENNTTAVAAENATEKRNGKALSKKLTKIAMSINTAIMMAMFSTINAFAEPPTTTASGGGSGGLDGGEGVESFNNIITFFAEWIGRIGLVVGFVGAVMFGLAIKNDDAEAKTRGLMTLASGFVVFAVTKALDMFGITSSAAIMLF